MKKLFPSILFLLATAPAVAQNLEPQIEELLKEMTLEEKVRLSYAQSKFSSPGVARLGVPELWMSDGPHGVRMEINWNDWNHANWTNDYCTAFPALTCLAATWNPEMATLYGHSVGEEARYRKKNVLLGPGVNLYRTPLNGRNFEYMGEDPVLSSAMVINYIQSLQDNGVACCVKHYALNEQEEFRGHVDVKVSDRALRELSLRPFEAAVRQGGAWSLMGSYNQYCDQHASHNEILLNKILKEEWGFDGAVISDWGAAHNTDEAARYGLDLEMGTYTNGLSTEANGFGYDDYYLGNAYLEKVKKGEIPMDVVNDKARRMLRLILRTSTPRTDAKNPLANFGRINTEDHILACRTIAQEGIVLLKNEALKGSSAALLPIDFSKYKKVLVVGDNATRKLTEGGGSSELKAKDEVSPLRTLQERFGKQVQITYAQGYTCGRPFYGRVDPVRKSTIDSLRQDAIAKAKEADLVIFIGGLNKNHFQDSEGGDRLSYNLDFGQDALISALAAANPNLVTVIVSGNAYAMPWLSEVPNLVQSWYLGSQAGPALVDVLTGAVCPSGKTPFTYAVALEDYPAHKLGRVGYPGIDPDSLPAAFQFGQAYNPKSADMLQKGFFEKQADAIARNSALNKRNSSANPRTHFGSGNEAEVYAEDILLGYRWFDAKGQNGTYQSKKSRVLFPFGFGLSYTTFQYGKPVINGNVVSVTVRNTGSVAGKEVVQFYVGDDKASVVRPVKELKHFEKVSLQPGEEKTISYTIADNDLKFYDETSRQWTLEPGSFTIYVAASAADVKGKVKYVK